MRRRCASIAEIEARFGLRAFHRIDTRSVLALTSEIATSTDRRDGRGEHGWSLRLDVIELSATSTLERLALIARAHPRKAAGAGLVRD